MVVYYNMFNIQTTRSTVYGENDRLNRINQKYFLNSMYNS